MLKAIELLKEELEEIRNTKGQVYSYIRERKQKIKEAIAELEDLSKLIDNLELYLSSGEHIDKIAEMKTFKKDKQ